MAKAGSRGRRAGVLTAVVIVLGLAILLLPACPTPAPPTPEPKYSLPELKYLLFARFDKVFFCDPDYYPIAREGQEEKNALEQFPAIKADTDEFPAILDHLALPDRSEYNTQEKMLIYREHKKLVGAAQLTAFQDGYRFVLRVGEDQGSRIEGVISTGGQVANLTNEPSINTCPICLSKGTLIETPSGPVPVEELNPGMVVWTLDDSRQRVAAKIVAVSSSLTPVQFRLCRLTLSDGRAITASAGHPTVDGRPLGDLSVGDALDGAEIVSVGLADYENGATFDLLPEGTSGLYWANGILLRSTLRMGPGAIYR